MLSAGCEGIIRYYRDLDELKLTAVSGVSVKSDFGHESSYLKTYLAANRNKKSKARGIVLAT